MHQFPRGSGWIEVICGSMFAGKTQELIRRLRLAALARQKVQVFKHTLDRRFGREDLVSHDQIRVPSQPVRRAADILGRLRPGVRVVGIDEAHFFGATIVPVCQTLADRGLRVIVAGLDQDYRARPFEPMAQLLAVAEYVDKLLAICLVCGGPAGRSQRLGEGRKRIDVGHSDKYEARCRRCFRPARAKLPSRASRRRRRAAPPAPGGRA
ncbi:MAG TPA: thymidine kinase [Planctomycetota bacterium]|nr:thymidine kinase [Planctomycetota bacterium]